MPQQPTTDWKTVTTEADDWQTVAAPQRSSSALSAPVESNWFDTAASYIPKPVKSAWNKTWEPLSDLPSRVMKPLAEMQYKYGESGDGLLNKLAMYGGAFDESIGNTLSALTSPGNLALTAATGGAGVAGRQVAQKALPIVAPKIAQGLTRTGQVIGAGTAAHGAQTIADPSTDWLQKAMGGLEMVGGGFAARAPKIRAAKTAAIPDELPLPDKITGNLDVDELMKVRKSQMEVKSPRMEALAEPTRPFQTVPETPIVPEEAAALSEAQPFNPATLKFIDPKTGEVKPATQARPGDVPLEGQAPPSPSPLDIPEAPASSQATMPVRPPSGFDYTTSVEGLPKDQARFNKFMAAAVDFPEEVFTELATLAKKYRALGGKGKEAAKIGNEMIIIKDFMEGAGKGKVSKIPESLSVRPSEAALSEVGMTPKLSRELQDAKPRFNVGADSYMPNFADDLDKALFIIAQTKRSKADASYLKFVMEQTGLDEATARSLGQQVKDAIKKAVVGKETGSIDIPSVARASKQLEGAPKQTPQEYMSGKSQVDTGPIVPGNVGPNPDVVKSLAQRLKRAVDDAGTTNATAAEDISSLMDEATEVLNAMPKGPEKAGIIRQVLGANKALLTSWDFSAPGRQGKAFILNKTWWTSLDDMVKAWGSKEAAHNINQSILDHPSGYFIKPVSETGKVGKSFAEKMGLDIAAHEEMFTGIAERMGAKIPLVQRSSRAHTAFLNKLRSDEFVSMMEMSKKAGANPEANELLAKSYAKFINDSTGRGSLNIGKWKLERNVNTLNDVFFAPKNMSGQIRTWNAVLNPAKYWNYDSVLRKQALKSLFAVAGSGMAVGEMARMAGAKVSNDPTNADFRKIKIGDTRIDMFGGYQQFPVTAMKLISGQSTSSISGKTTDLTANKFGQQTRFSVAERFFINRLSPAASFIYSWMSNKEFDGQPFEVKRALFERTFPIAAKDIIELTQEDPELALLLGPTTLMGLTGTQTYTGR